MNKRVRGNLSVRSILVAALAALPMITLAPVSAQPPTTCGDGWESSEVVSGLGVLENLEPDGAGGFYLAGLERGVIYHVDAERRVTTVASGIDSPAGIRLVGDTLYFISGDSPEANLLNLPTGALNRLDLTTGTVEVLVDGLTAPNGLLLLPDGDLLFSWAVVVGPGTGVSRYSPATGTYTPNWAPVPSSNGLSLTPDRTAVYVSNSTTGSFYRVPLDAPGEYTTLPGGFGAIIEAPDDLQATATDQIYVAVNFSGKVSRYDPASGKTCDLSTGMYTVNIPPGPTSVRIAPDGDRLALYVTASTGSLYRLRPPSGVDLTPA
ncbi:SMP-30/gluconolactonase/LRE family protein [Nocardia sp. NPDC058658]|uniref:SMP-30/gluconolactonase/LRE family protein n=1 Tax=Nocardia sp. NPDC058658 TaxID=3346580 RepID=UPI003654B9C9